MCLMHKVDKNNAWQHDTLLTHYITSHQITQTHTYLSRSWDLYI